MVKNVVDQERIRNESCQEEDKVQCRGCATPDLQNPSLNAESGIPSRQCQLSNIQLSYCDTAEEAIKDG